MLDLKLDRPAAPPKDAATIVLVRDAIDGLEIFCVERSKQSRFLGGAIVFPGGKVDADDAAEEWRPLATSPRVRSRPSLVPFSTDDVHHRALAIAAARETLEEAAMLHVIGAQQGPPLLQEDLFALRSRLSVRGALRAFLAEHSLLLDLQALHPLSRWVTPEAEARRYDARFFVAVAPRGQVGAHDEHETTASFWAKPLDVLRRWEKGEVQVAPPTHRTIAQLASCATTEAVLAFAAETCLDPICPRLIQQQGNEEGQADTLALTLPGDPEHSVAESRIEGPSRYVLRGDRWRAEDAPR